MSEGLAQSRYKVTALEWRLEPVFYTLQAERSIVQEH